MLALIIPIRCDEFKISYGHVVYHRTEQWLVDEQFIYYIRAPSEYYGNRLHSYGGYLTFSLRSRFGVDVNLTGTQPVVLEGSGKCVRYATVFVLLLYCTPTQLVVSSNVKGLILLLSVARSAYVATGCV